METFVLIGLLIFLGQILLTSRKQGSKGGMNLFNIGKSKAKIFSPETVNVKFKDVAGLDEAKL